MKLYRIVIVDDEAIFRVGFKTSVDWQKHGFEIVGEAPNGAEAIDRIELYKPHIVITDIKMPIMNGIDLIKYIKINYPLTIIIVLSNYNDFELVREALILGADDYFLKITNDFNKFVDFLKKITERICFTKNIIDNNTIPFNIFSNNITVFNITNLIQMILSKSTIDTFCGGILLISIPFLNNIIKQRYEDKMSKFIKILCATLSTITAEYNEICLAICSDQQFILIINNRKVFLEKQSHRVASIIHSVLEQYLGLKGVISYGINYNNIENLNDLLIRHKNLFDYNFYNNGLSLSKFNLNNDYSEFNMLMPMDIDCLNSSIKNLYFDKLHNTITKILERAIHSEIDPMFIKEYLSKIMLIAESNLLSYKPNLSNPSSQMFIFNIYNSCNIIELIAFVEETINLFIDKIKNTHFQYRDETMQVINYIEKNYSHKINLEDIANHIHISKGYLSMIFKTDLNISFQDYLIKIRMEKAAQLLITTTLKTYEIAEIVGYNDIFYFNRSFRNFFNASPKEFKKRIGN